MQSKHIKTIELSQGHGPAIFAPCLYHFEVQLGVASSASVLEGLVPIRQRAESRGHVREGLEDRDHEPFLILGLECGLTIHLHEWYSVTM